MGAISNFLFGDNSNKTSYKQAAYDKYYQQAMGNVVDKIYDNDDDGNLQKLNLMTSLNDTSKNSLANYNATKNQVFGNGIIGTLLNPVAQTAGAIGDLAALGISGGKTNAWDKNNDKTLGTSRDWLSDLGAAGMTALSIPTLGSAAGATAGAKTLGSTIAKGALTGAGYGLAGGLNEMGAENFDAGKLALGTAIGAGVGGGMSGLGYGLGKLKNYTNKTVENTVNNKEYQEALNTLKSEGITGEGKDLEKSFKSWATVNHPDKAGKAVAALPENAGKSEISNISNLTSGEKITKSQLSGSPANNIYLKANDFRTPVADYMEEINKQAVENATSRMKTVQDAMNVLKKTPAYTTTYTTVKPSNLKEALSNIKYNLGNSDTYQKMANSNIGKATSNLLKTKTGKIGAGVGGGLLLAKLLNGNNSNSNELTDEELQELYNYYYGGQ